MPLKLWWQRCISFLLVTSFLLSMVACSDDNASDENTEGGNSGGSIIIDDAEINDSFVRLEINPLQVNSISTQAIEIDEILVHCIEVKDIEDLEIEITTINDEFVYLAYKNFVSVYGEDFSLRDFLVDVGIGATCILVCVTLSVAGGPVGTFFGAVITSEFTASAIVVGAAIDAAVSGYLAYQEGGDASYIIGHMLNGVADGFKWSAILAPVTGAVSGIKALRAVSELKKVPGFEELTDKQARKVLEQLADIVKKSSDVGDDFSDQAIKELYQKLSKEAQEEITEDMLRNILTNKKLLTDIVLKYNPFNVASDVAKTMKENFLKNAGLSDSAGKNLIKQLQNGTIKSLDDISDTAAREYIQKHMYEFVQCFGRYLSKDFIDNSLKNIVGPNIFDTIKKSISSSTLFADLVEELGSPKAVIEQVFRSDAIMLMQLRYGSENVTRLICAGNLYRCMLWNSKDIPSEALRTVLEWFMDGTSKTYDEIYKQSAEIAKNLYASREAVAATLSTIGRNGPFAELLNDFSIKGLQQISIPEKQAKDIVFNALSKADIISMYGDETYQTLVQKYYLAMGCLQNSSVTNQILISEITSDALKNRGLSRNSISRIMNGLPVSEWGLNDEMVVSVYNVVAEYYQSIDQTLYSSLADEVAEIRGHYVSDFVKQAEITLINAEDYAGSIMTPSGTNADYIRAKYGDIFMSESGFPILDEYAIARVELDDLTGLNDGKDDIIRANKIHHGNGDSIPGYTWHHLEEGRTLILIPTELHTAYRHTGGASLLREGLKEALG